MIHFRHAALGEFGPLGLELLGRAGHDRNHNEVLLRNAQLAWQCGLAHRPEHLLRRFARGQIRQQIREILLGELDPARAATRKLRQLLAFGLPLQEFIGLFNDRQVGAERGIIDLVEAEAFERRDDLAAGRHAGGQPESLSDRHAYRRGDLGNHSLDGIVERPPNLVHLGPGR